MQYWEIQVLHGIVAACLERLQKIWCRVSLPLALSYKGLLWWRMKSKHLLIQTSLSLHLRGSQADVCSVLVLLWIPSVT